MIQPLRLVCSLFLSYVIGSIPTAYLLGRVMKGIDIRSHGSGNVGATNAFRVLGKIPGSIVLLVDVGKGLLCPTLLADGFGLEAILERVLLGLAVVLGHSFSVFLKFKGGKGVATSLGVLIGLTIKIPIVLPVLMIALLIWLGVFLISGFVSLASVVSVTAVPLVMVLLNQPFEIISLGIILCVFVVVRHKSNIQRILTGKESRIVFFRKKRFDKP